MSINLQRVQHLIETLATISGVPEELIRLRFSHNPLEFTAWNDIEAGIKVLQKVVLEQAEVC